VPPDLQIWQPLGQLAQRRSASGLTLVPVLVRSSLAGSVLRCPPLGSRMSLCLAAALNRFAAAASDVPRVPHAPRTREARASRDRRGRGAAWLIAHPHDA
jgi:hypothetical protein